MNARPMQARPNGPSAKRNYPGSDTADAVDHWHVQLANGELRVVSLDKLDDLYRYDVIDESAFVWQSGMTNWARLSDVLAAHEAEPSDSVSVLLGPGNVKEVTLEQLGDYYRYGTVNGATLVWKAGMPEWTHLATLIGEPEPEPEEPFHVLFGPGNVKVVTLDQLDDYYRYDVVDESTLVWQKGMPEWQSLGRVAGIEPATPSEAAPTSSMRPIHRQAPAPVVAFVPSAPPVSFSIEPPLPHAEPARGGRWLVRLAVAAGIVMALLRNDIALSAIRSAGMAPKYVALEQRYLGGPAFGTTRAVEQLVSNCGGHLEPVRLPAAVGQHAESRSGTSPALAPTVQATVAVAAPTAVGPTVQATATGLGKPPAKTLAATNPKRANVSVSNSNASRPKKRASSKTVLKAGGSYFDPLNPSL